MHRILCGSFWKPLTPSSCFIHPQVSKVIFFFVNLSHLTHISFISGFWKIDWRTIWPCEIIKTVKDFLNSVFSNFIFFCTACIFQSDLPSPLWFRSHFPSQSSFFFPEWEWLYFPHTQHAVWNISPWRNYRDVLAPRSTKHISMLTWTTTSKSHVCPLRRLSLLCFSCSF